jgi:hypothetical protein
MNGARGSISFRLAKKAHDFYADQGYVFPDQFRFTVIDSSGNPCLDEVFTSDYSWDSGYWGFQKDSMDFITSQLEFEGELKMILTVDVTKNGIPEQLVFRMREDAYSSQNNQGMHLKPRYNLYYYFNDRGEFTKIRQ